MIALLSGLALSGGGLVYASAAGEDVAGSGLPPGVIWNGQENSVEVDTLAREAAPILWFTRDEPLAHETIPAPLPCGRPTRAPGAPGQARVAYYRVAEILVRKGHVGSPWHLEQDLRQTLDLAGIVWLKFRYFFYYPEDIGLNSHRHDLEGVELLLAVDSSRGSYSVRVIGVTGLAHGLTWSANRLDVERTGKAASGRSLVLPVTVFVEEGKHASCPDRTGDGAFTPGDDVNVYSNDAWGVRDDFGSGRLRGHYGAEQTKPRFPDNRVFPPLESSHPRVAHYRGRFPWPPDRATYDLLASLDWDVSDCPPPHFDLACPDHKCLDLKGQLEAQGFSSPPRLVDDSFRGRYEVRRGIPLRPTLENSAISLAKAETWQLVLGLALPAPSVDGWLGLRLITALQGRGAIRGVAAQYTPSASRWIDPYVQGSLMRVPRKGGHGFATYPFVEAGAKVRFRLGESRVFLGLRAGVEARGLGRLHDLRLRFEIGTGAF